MFAYENSAQGCKAITKDLQIICRGNSCRNPLPTFKCAEIKAVEFLRQGER